MIFDQEPLSGTTNVVHPHSLSSWVSESLEILIGSRSLRQDLSDTQGGGRFNSTNPQRRNTDIFLTNTLYALAVGHGPDPHPHNHLESFSISTYNLLVSSLNNLSSSFLLDTVQHGHQTQVGRGDFEIQKNGSNKTHMMMKIMTPHQSPAYCRRIKKIDLLQDNTKAKISNNNKW